MGDVLPWEYLLQRHDGQLSDCDTSEFNTITEEFCYTAMIHLLLVNSSTIPSLLPCTCLKLIAKVAVSHCSVAAFLKPFP